MMALLHFIIAGTPKCGTTALWAYLKEHPEICMATIKEPSFFSSEKVGELNKPKLMEETGAWMPLMPGRFFRGKTWYESLFKHCHDKQKRGEASTRYFSGPSSPELIKSTVSDVKLIFLLRHPVERLYSQYWQELRTGLKMPDFIDLVTNNHPRFQYFRQVSAYKYQLERYYEKFPTDQILVLLNMDLKQKPLETVQQVFEFIEVNSTFVPKSLGKTFNPQVAPRYPALQRAVMRFKARYLTHIPVGILPYSRPIMKTIRRLNLKKKKQSPPPIPQNIRQQLAHYFEEDIVYVEKLLGRDLSTWRT